MLSVLTATTGYRYRLFLYVIRTVGPYTLSLRPAPKRTGYCYTLSVPLVPTSYRTAAPFKLTVRLSLKLPSVHTRY